MSSDFLLKHLARVNADLEAKGKGSSSKKDSTNKRKTSGVGSIEKNQSRRRGSNNYLDGARHALKRQSEIKSKHKKLLAIASNNRKVKKRKKGEGYI